MPPFPTDAEKSCLRRCTSWLRVVVASRREVEGLEAHRFGCRRRKSRSQPGGAASERGLLSGHLRFTSKKEDRFSPEKARVLICCPSCHYPAVRSCLLQSRVLSLEVSSESIPFYLPLSFLLPYYTCIDDNCANSLRTYHAIRFELRGTFTAL